VDTDSSNSLTPASPILREQLQAILQETFGSRVEIVDTKIGNQRHDYLVLLIRLASPDLTVVVKLAGPEAPYDCPFERTAVIHQLVAAQTTIPMPEILAVDVSYQKWPWRYIIKAYLPGEEWVSVVPQLDAAQTVQAYRQFGNAVAQIHNIVFPTFGELTTNGRVENGSAFLPALKARAKVYIQNGRLLDYFYSVLDHYTPLFADVGSASLCHEDLHKFNILFHRRQGQWQLATILDFDKGWAGHYEIDLAWLNLWTGMMTDDFWHAYEEVKLIDPLYQQRRPVYQLLWCLEYAMPTEKHLADTRQVCQELGFPVIDAFE
jgi:aminoglycoside phosphotransferase (APT) family kinase protein